MKLYIPTCTLNFNNILSSESISPLGFYAIRGFGNKRFYPVFANDKEQVIILYSKYPRFEIKENDLENYPMVIEIETDDYKDGFFEKAKEHDGVETYLCYHTINLNPFHSRIYFNSDQDRQGVLTKAEQSLENKFYKRYALYIDVKPKEKKTAIGVVKDFLTQSEKDDFLWNPSYVNLEIKNVPIDVSRDVQLDRIKGFIYCYLIGANSSVSNEVGKLKALSRKLRNTLSAVVNSPDKRPTQAQDDAISNGIREFNEIYSSIYEDTIWNKNLVESKLSDNPKGLSTKDAKDLPLPRVYDATELKSCLECVSPETFSRVIDNMNSAIRKLEAKYNAQREKYAIEELLNVEDNLSLHILDLDTSYQSTFYKNLICSQFNAKYKSVMEENGVEEPLAQAYNGGMILRNMLGDKWDSDPASAYVGALLNHFQENSAFNLFAIENDVLSSFAAFCQKGDNIDRLVEYLVQVVFCNYKLAYGIYGATRGFTSLPKTFTSVLINGDKDYYQSFASNVWRMLNGIEIKGAVLPKASNNTSVIVESQLGSKIIENQNNVESAGELPNKEEPVKVRERQSIDTESVSSEDQVTPNIWGEDIREYAKSLKIKDKAKLLKSLDDALAQNADNQDIFIFITNLANYDGWKPVKNGPCSAWTKMQKHFVPDYNQRIGKSSKNQPVEKKKEKPQQLSLDLQTEDSDNVDESRKQLENLSVKSDPKLTPKTNTDASRVQYINGKSFITDNNCWNSIKHLVPDNYHVEFLKDLKWFQDEFAKGEASRYYARTSRENSATIDAFGRFIERRTYGSQINVPELKDYLRKIYVR